MVAYFFPPLGGGGIQRVLKYATYLPRAGWQPVVVTPRNADYEPMDPDLLAQIPPEAEVHRSYCWEPSRLYRWLVRVTRYRPAGGGTRATLASAADSAVVSNPGRWARLADILFFPDLQIFWIPFAVRSALRAHRVRPMSAIFSSSPPVTTHLIAGLLKRLTGLPWVADFRDPWIGNVYAAELPRPHRWLRRRVERWIVDHADRVMFATPSLTQEYADRYPDRASAFVTITNGYDAIDLAAIRGKHDRGPVFNLTYTGSLYGHDELPIFLGGLERFLERDPGARTRLRVEFVGLLNARNRAIADRYSAPDRLGGVVEFTGFLAHEAALRRLETADAALLLVAGDPGKEVVISGKLYEYLGADKPVLAMVPEGDARTILHELDWGVIADPDPDSVADALARMISAPLPRGPADPERRYERVKLAAHLGRVLDEVAARGLDVATASAREDRA
jgi:glycosyltransferase involved in cell wall biosynthesis